MSVAVKDLKPLETKTATLSQQFAAFASQFELAQVPEAVKQYAKLCVADAIGIGFASHRFAFAQKSIAGVSSIAGAGDVPIVGTSLTLAPRDAALLNGILVHGLDFDDTHVGGVIHGSASAVPLIISEGNRHHSSGADILTAYILAMEADARIGILAQGMFQKIGFHPTGMVGIFGCTLASSYLSSLDQEQTAKAQGIALSMASGSLEFLDDGSWTKRMHPGWSASSAITATALAKNGFTGPLKAYEGRYGLYNLYLQNQDISGTDSMLDDLGSTWETKNIAIKPYPVCHFNHGCIDSMRELQRAHNLQAADIESIVALIHEKQADVVCEPEDQKRRPQNDYEGKFSVHFAVAATAVRQKFTLSELEDDALNDPEILALCDRITYQHDPESAYPQYYSGGLIVKTKDGQTLTHREKINRGADVRALNESDVKDKFLGNVTSHISSVQAKELWNTIMNLDNCDDLTALNKSLMAEN